MADLILRQGDTPKFSWTMLDSSGNPLNLTGITNLRFVMRQITSNQTTTDITASSPTSGTSPALVNATTGQVAYTFGTGDSMIPGQFMAEWHYTNAAGLVVTSPPDGYIEVTVEENLNTPGGARLVGLGEAKDYLNIPSTDRTRDAKLVRFIEGIGPVIEAITGPVIQTVIQAEHYDGGQYSIELLRRPLIAVHQVIEYRGPIPYNLTQVASADQGTIYSYMWNGWGRLTRRTVGGGITRFPPGYDAVVVTYTAGRMTVPANITLATLELLRIHFQGTQQGRPRWGPGAGAADYEEPGREILGFFVPNSVREMLSPHKRHPSIA